ncbi:GvpL/GvpF family gas vesicle protein [Actinacidiphila acidipaludis]|uniref:GvpL/GvpF family gas vesicle protein n=1 Tax=Actinacidiphila acidipaludis TaxID=2873382 RepID=A0ABS7PZE3_9ACTN|nr:GvpL/GvpF family gas vesicle protein [Streptomyces acidipaludis]MBY8876108.1 GvpL/GvpF family gas vesicle protein [Streptomyces acidipaludis]
MTGGRSPEPTPAGNDASVTSLCVFAVCAVAPGDQPIAGTEALGHAESGPLTLLPLDAEMAALVQEVPAERFTEEALREHLADPAALEAYARAHHAVVTAASAAGPVVPLPLATLFADHDRAREVLSENLPRFREALDRVRGRAEWAVKVHLRRDDPPPDQAASDRGASAAGTPSAAGAGRAYLSRVRGREKDRISRRDAATAAAQRVHEAANTVAAGSVRLRPHGQEITGKDRLQVMNAAYLVDEARSAELSTVLAALRTDLAGSAIEIDVSGPWVPYSFTAGEES